MFLCKEIARHSRVLVVTELVVSGTQCIVILHVTRPFRLCLSELQSAGVISEKQALPPITVILYQFYLNKDYQVTN